MRKVEKVSHYAGIGAAVGAIVNRASRGRNLLYGSPAPSRSVTLEPVFTPQRAAVSMAIRW